ncbi:TPA: glycosyltransferase family 9 protein, partial [Campylobacter fetus subsp. venerealis]|nr:glycosyltransferase family 9 protein [Campylobacter fetus subsp. venerealis]
MKILIIKLGYSETFIDDNSRVVSLGDVLRATPIIEALHQKYNNAKISWL